MGVSLGDLHFTLGIDESQLDAQLAKAKAKITAALVDPSITAANLNLALKSAKIDATRALEKQRLDVASAALAKKLDIESRSQTLLNNANLAGIGISQRNAAAQMTASNAAWLSAQRTAQARSQSITAQNQSLASAQRLTSATNAATISQQRLANYSGITSRAMLTQNGIALRLGSTLGSAFTIAGIYTFIKQLATVRGEFELQQVALRAITRDKEAADKIFGQVKTLSVMSPFTFQELLRDTKQLAAFSVETDKLYGTLTRLADVSSGLGVDMSRIILAYGQVKSATVLRGQELRQFTEAGIPIIDMLANKYSKLEGTMVSAGEVFQRVSKRMVSFKDVDEIFTSLTSSGGMFFEMQKKQSETLTGKISNLKDAYQIMLNTIGESQDSTLKGGVDTLTSMMRNWETIAEVMKVVIAAYGAFKVAQMIAIANAKLNAAANVLVAESGGFLVASDARQIVMKTRLLAVTNSLNKAMLLNPYVLAAAAIAAMSVVLYNAYENAHKLERELNKLFTESSSEATATVIKVDTLKRSLKEAADGTQKRADIIKELNTIMSPYLEKNLKESDSYEKIAASVDKATKSLYENARSKLYTAGMAKIDESQKEAIGASESRLRESLKTTFKVGDTIATDIMQGIFAAVRDDPKVASTYAGVIELTKKQIEKAAKDSGKPIDMSSLTVATSRGMDTFSGVSSIMAFGESMTKTAQATSLLEEKLRALGPVQTDNERNYAKQKILLDAKIKAEEDDAYNSLSAEKYQQGKHDRTVKRLKEEESLLREYGFTEEANAKARAIQEQDPEGTLAKRIMIGVDALKQFKEANRSVAKSLIEDKPDSELYAVYAAAVKTAKEELDQALATPAKTLVGSTANEADKTKFIAPLKEKYELYKTINEQLLGQYSKEDLKNEKREENAANHRKAAMDRLNEQYLKDKEEFANFDMGIEAKRIANMEDSMAKELMINELSFAKKEADITRLRTLTLARLNAAAGIKRGAANEITDYSQTTSVISKLSEKQLPTSERAAVQAASDQALADERQARINNEKSKAEAVIAINRDWALKISDIWRDVDAIFLSGTEKERAAINKKYDDWARQAKLAGSYNKDTIATGTPASDILPAVDKKRTDNEQKAADLSVLIERRRNGDMIQLNNKLASDRLTIEEEVEHNLNAIRLSGWGDNEKLMEADFKTSQNYATRKIALLRAQTLAENPQRNEQVTAAESAKDLAAKNEELRKQKKLYSDIVGAAKDIQNIFADFGIELGDGVNKYLEGVGKILDGVSSMDVTKPFTLVTGGIKVLSGMADQVSAIFGDSAHKLSQATIDYYDDLMSTMNDVISVHKKLMDELSGSAAVSESAKTIELIKKQIEATRQLGLEYLASNAAHSHTYGHQLALSLDEYRAQLKAIGVDLSDMSGGIGQLFTMTPKQLEQIKEEVPAAWAKIDDQTRAYLQTIIDSGTALDDTTAALGEALTNLSYDSAKSELQDLISDTDKTMADISTNFEKYMRDAIINSIMKGDVQTLIQKWYTDFTAAMSDGALTEQEKASLQAEYEAIGQEAINKRDAALAAAGLSTTSDVAKKGLSGEIKGVTEDTVQLLASLLNAVRGDVSLQNISLKSIEGILSNTGSVTANSLAQLVMIQSNTFNMMTDIRSMMGGKGSIGTGLRVIIQ